MFFLACPDALPEEPNLTVPLRFVKKILRTKKKVSSNANVPFWESCSVFAHLDRPKKEPKRWSRRGRIPPCPYGARKK